MRVGAAEGGTERAFRALLSAFVRGRVHVHFESTDGVVAALEEAGFVKADVRPAERAARDRATRIAHTIEAWSR
jgi:hypothetical protein